MATPPVFDRLQYAKMEGKAWGIFGADSHLGGGEMGAFVSLSAAIARALSSTSVGSTALRKCTRRF